MEMTTAIQSEQHVKKELARRMGELQEELHNIKEQVCHTKPSFKQKCNHAYGFFVVVFKSLCSVAVFTKHFALTLLLILFINNISMIPDDDSTQKAIKSTLLCGVRV